MLRSPSARGANISGLVVAFVLKPAPIPNLTLDPIPNRNPDPDPDPDSRQAQLSGHPPPLAAALAAAMRPGEMAREKKVAALLDRAIARGELRADIDRRMVSDAVIGPLYWRLVVIGDRCGPREVETLARMTAAAIRAV